MNIQRFGLGKKHNLATNIQIHIQLLGLNKIINRDLSNSISKDLLFLS
jgi:hypothetical protein